MTIPHAAALALVGWYLIDPPLSPDKKLVAGYAPLSKWYIRGAYDSVTDCDKALLWGGNGGDVCGPESGRSGPR
jgi:hypothetical protein